MSNPNEAFATLSDAIENDLSISIPVDPNRTPLKERKARTERDAKALIPLVRVWLGNTTLKELWQKARNKVNTKIHVYLTDGPNMVNSASAILSPNAIKFFHEQAVRLNFFQVNRKNETTGENERVTEVPDLQSYLDPMFCRIPPEAEQEGPAKINVWAIIRAISQAVNLANYGQFKKQSGFCYTADSNHRMVQQCITGQQVWTDPTMVTFSWRPADTEEDYLRPYQLIPFEYENPEVPGEMLQTKIKVYRRTVNVLKPEAFDPDKANEMDLIQRVGTLSTGEYVDHHYDNELRDSEIERQIDSDLAFLDRWAQDNGKQVYPMVLPDGKTVRIYYQGLASELRAPVPQENAA